MPVDGNEQVFFCPASVGQQVRQPYRGSESFIFKCHFLLSQMGLIHCIVCVSASIWLIKGQMKPEPSVREPECQNREGPRSVLDLNPMTMKMSCL